MIGDKLIGGIKTNPEFESFTDEFGFIKRGSSDDLVEVIILIWFNIEIDSDHSFFRSIGIRST